MRITRVLATAVGVAVMVVSLAVPVGAAPKGNHSPNAEPAFEVNCDGTSLTLVNPPSNVDRAEFTAAFVTTSHQVVVPFSFDASQTATSLTDGAVFGGVTYNSGDVIFSGSQSVGIGVQRPQSATCTFGGTSAETLTDDNGTLVDVEFAFSGSAKVLLPGRP